MTPNDRAPQVPEQREKVVVVGDFNWETVEGVEIEPFQHDFVASVGHYRRLCEDPSTPWSANAIENSGRVVGFVMTAVEVDVSTYWIGGLMIDRTVQNRGIARRALESLIDRAGRVGLQHVALTCAPNNVVANRLYAALGFAPTGSAEGVELVLERDV